MDYQEILELKKRMDFNMTEHETLVKLVEEASSKGEKAQGDMERFRNNAKRIVSRLKEGEDWFREDTLSAVVIPHEISVGIDGGFQTVGGVGGIWYAPISVVRVVFEKSINSQPTVDIFWAGIEEFMEGQDGRNPNTIAAEKMLVGETKALMDWGARNNRAIVFRRWANVCQVTYEPRISSAQPLRHGARDAWRSRFACISRCARHARRPHG